MYPVNNARLTRLPFFSRLFHPPGVFSPRIFRLPLFHPRCRRPAPRSEPRRKPEKFRQREPTESRSFDPPARQTRERSGLWYPRACIHARKEDACACATRITCKSPGPRPHDVRTCIVSVRFLANRARDWKLKGSGWSGWRAGGGGGLLWRTKWSLALAVITRAKEIKSGTKTGISERREKIERCTLRRGRGEGGGQQSKGGGGGKERDTLWCARVSVILPAD